MQVGFIGLGNMGSRMAANLKKGGHQLVVHDRSIAAMEEACKDGAEAASSPVDMASQEGIVAWWTCDMPFQARLGGYVLQQHGVIVLRC